ncbi:hypothetical protein, partial [Aeromicrobium sp.]|uniref:hypothetical protein n=1 Tax=Aeromicrobium sp. TaxID=1871063 RepID=UPI0019B47AC5
MSRESNPAARATTRQLLVVDDEQLVYLHASAAAAETTVVIAEGADDLALVDERFDVVVVAGFTASPGLLRSMVERAFDLGAKGVKVMIGAALHPIDEDVNAWETAFAGVSVMVHESLLPGVRVTRSPSADEGSGAVLHGLLKALGAGVDLATKNPRVPDEPTVPVAPTTPTASEAPQKSGGNIRKKGPERSVQTAVRFSR